MLSLAVAVSVLCLPLSAQKEVSPKAEERIQKEVRHQLVMLPYLSVFDNLTYKVEGYDVTLVGQVVNPPSSPMPGMRSRELKGARKL
jgi:hyperosmotically inducible periplasmic protein